MENKRDWECTEKEEGRARRGGSFLPCQSRRNRAVAGVQQLRASLNQLLQVCVELIEKTRASELLWQPCTRCSVQMICNYREFTSTGCHLTALNMSVFFRGIFSRKGAFCGQFSDSVELAWFWGDLYFPEWHCDKLPLTDNITESRTGTVPTIWLRFVRVCLPLLPELLSFQEQSSVFKEVSTKFSNMWYMHLHVRSPSQVTEVRT